MKLKVENEDSLYRDSDTGAIINIDKKAFEQVRAARRRTELVEKELEEVKAEIQVLKSMIRGMM